MMSYYYTTYKMYTYVPSIHLRCVFELPSYIICIYHTCTYIHDPAPQNPAGFVSSKRSLLPTLLQSYLLLEGAILLKHCYHIYKES